MSHSHPETLWMDGRLIPWADAKVHVLSHALHYGTSFFEGIRVYDTPQGPCAFRLDDHLTRLELSARIYNCDLPYEVDTLREACCEVVAANQLPSAYLRPIVFYGHGGLGVAPSRECPVHTVIAGFAWGAYLGEEGLAQGIDVCVSSWRRVAPNTIPAGAKAGGNYLSSVLISTEAKSRGCAEGIGLDVNGLLSEGAGENLFLVQDGVLLTPPSSASILSGITRDTVIKLARRDGLEVREQTLPREALYAADEVFLTGTAAEITPVRSVDGCPIGAGTRGPVTERLQTQFFGLFDGSMPDDQGWLTPVHSV